MKGVDGFWGERLTEAREARAITKSHLADLVEVTPAQITRYERDEHSPSPKTLEKMSLILGMPINYFFFKRERPLDNTSTIFYRSLSSATKRQRLSAESKYRWLQDIYSYLWEFVEFPNVNLPDFSPPDSPELISGSFIEKSADKLREYWEVGERPIDNITRLVENNGIVLGFYDLGADSLDAFSQRCFDRPHIIVSTRKEASVRYRFDICHELGHLILHRNIPSNIFRTGTYFKLMERQAHHFAGAFIFPQSAFLDEVRLANLTNFRLRKPRWKLSIAAMIFRAENLGLIDQEAAEKLRMSYGRRRWRTFEPFDDEIAIEFPELLKDAFDMIVQGGVKTKSEIVEELPYRRKDIEQISGLPEGFLRDDLVKKMRLRDQNSGSKVVDLSSYR
jgi:Zn-dependent peptidase ImmA (M78 family)/DNA-binding XRE family transcriptional regulator